MDWFCGIKRVIVLNPIVPFDALSRLNSETGKKNALHYISGHKYVISMVKQLQDKRHIYNLVVLTFVNEYMTHIFAVHKISIQSPFPAFILL